MIKEITGAPVSCDMRSIRTWSNDRSAYALPAFLFLLLIASAVVTLSKDEQIRRIDRDVAVMRTQNDGWRPT